ncbi:MAG: undecaprenyl-diphosphatase UppP [Anaerolineaceae bacterium]|nr:undecaprenyl-diphosphatase UppP [Anaerolineaceae bacterium]
MTIFQAFILGIVQGLTEFLPISSSGHLVLVPFLFGWELNPEQVFPFDTLVQMGTLVAVIIYFWQDLAAIVRGVLKGLAEREPFATQQARLGWLLVLATIPAGAAGLLLEDVIEAAFQSARATAIFLLLTAGLLLVAEWLGKRNREMEELTWKDALWIGAAQVLALFPGVSRSGSTIAGGMTRDLKRGDAASFSFLMSVPVMLAAGGYSAYKLLKMPGLSDFLPVMAVGFVTAGVVGYLSIRWLLEYLQNHSLKGFAIYCAVAAAMILVLSYVL